MIQFEKPDGPVFMTPDADLAISVFSHEDVEGGLLLSFFFHRPIFGFLGHIILGYLSSPMTTSLPLVDSA
jgi:hypothetical protein